ncbi:cytochrome b [Stenomitos frigidus]|uniref:Cytochrome B n=1 Tax=Stenomitos frigidus ULC18 TaxID=2107698 RepID=A0A2T1DZD1_9CYAN|nr:cytochrome b/b6 domain-containing protein [Stenomitos frigidus]PSB25858.1 cytochrome B [Stenomitos frigidus ULC18]
MPTTQQSDSSPTPKRNKTTAQRLWFVHWLMAAFYLLLFASGLYMTGLSREVSYRGSLYGLHKTLGVVVMSLLLARISVLLSVVLHKYRRRLPKTTLRWWRMFALHVALYTFMLLVPLSGYLFSNANAKDVVLWGTNIILPPLVGADKGLAEFGRSAHFWLSYTFLAFIALHALEQRRYLYAMLRRSYSAIAKITA